MPGPGRAGGCGPKQLFAFDDKAADNFAAGGATFRGARIAGLDEAGRGPLAGPVVAAAVIFFRPVPLRALNDSKQVPARVRTELFSEISKHAWVGIGMADEPTIDRINIYQATRLAMRAAVLNLSRSPDALLVDGNLKLDLPIPQQAVIRGDQKSASIAAASIVAKVYRDAWMALLDERYPGYAFRSHKGYSTPRHLERLRFIGPSPVHRRSFRPVRELLQDENETLP